MAWDYQSLPLTRLMLRLLCLLVWCAPTHDHARTNTQSLLCMHDTCGLHRTASPHALSSALWPYCMSCNWEKPPIVSAFLNDTCHACYGICDMNIFPFLVRSGCTRLQCIDCFCIVDDREKNEMEARGVLAFSQAGLEIVMQCPCRMQMMILLMLIFAFGHAGQQMEHDSSICKQVRYTRWVWPFIRGCFCFAVIEQIGNSTEHFCLQTECLLEATIEEAYAPFQTLCVHEKREPKISVRQIVHDTIKWNTMPVKGDGNCFWRAIALGHGTKWYNVKKKCLLLGRQNPHLISDWRLFCQMSCSGAWANQVSIELAACVLGRHVCVEHEGAMCLFRPHEDTHRAPVFVRLHDQHFERISQAQGLRTLVRGLDPVSCDLDQHLKTPQWARPSAMHRVTHYGKCSLSKRCNQAMCNAALLSLGEASPVDPDCIHELHSLNPALMCDLHPDCNDPPVDTFLHSVQGPKIAVKQSKQLCRQLQSWKRFWNTPHIAFGYLLTLACLMVHSLEGPTSPDSSVRDDTYPDVVDSESHAGQNFTQYMACCVESRHAVMEASWQLPCDSDSDPEHAAIDGRHECHCVQQLAHDEAESCGYGHCKHVCLTKSKVQVRNVEPYAKIGLTKEKFWGGAQVAPNSSGNRVRYLHPKFMTNPCSIRSLCCVMAASMTCLPGTFLINDVHMHLEARIRTDCLSDYVYRDSLSGASRYCPLSCSTTHSHRFAVSAVRCHANHAEPPSCNYDHVGLTKSKGKIDVSLNLIDTWPGNMWNMCHYALRWCSECITRAHVGDMTRHTHPSCNRINGPQPLIETQPQYTEHCQQAYDAHCLKWVTTRRVGQLPSARLLFHLNGHSPADTAAKRPHMTLLPADLRALRRREAQLRAVVADTTATATEVDDALAELQALRAVLRTEETAARSRSPPPQPAGPPRGMALRVQVSQPRTYVPAGRRPPASAPAPPPPPPVPGRDPVGRGAQSSAAARVPPPPPPPAPAHAEVTDASVLRPTPKRRPRPPTPPIGPSRAPRLAASGPLLIEVEGEAESAADNESVRQAGPATPAPLLDSLRDLWICSVGARFPCEIPNEAKYRQRIVCDVRHVADPQRDHRLGSHLGFHPDTLRRMLQLPEFREAVKAAILQLDGHNRALLVLKCAAGRHRSVAGVVLAEAAIRHLAPAATIHVAHLASHRWGDSTCNGLCHNCSWRERSRDPFHHQFALLMNEFVQFCRAYMSDCTMACDLPVWMRSTRHDTDLCNTGLCRTLQCYRLTEKNQKAGKQATCVCACAWQACMQSRVMLVLRTVPQSVMTVVLSVMHCPKCVKLIQHDKNISLVTLSRQSHFMQNPMNAICEHRTVAGGPTRGLPAFRHMLGGVYLPRGSGLGGVCLPRGSVFLSEILYGPRTIAILYGPMPCLTKWCALCWDRNSVRDFEKFACFLAKYFDSQTCCRDYAFDGRRLQRLITLLTALMAPCHFDFYTANFNGVSLSRLNCIIGPLRCGVQLKGGADDEKQENDDAGRSPSGPHDWATHASSHNQDVQENAEIATTLADAIGDLSPIPLQDESFDMDQHSTIDWLNTVHQGFSRVQSSSTYPRTPSWVGAQTERSASSAQSEQASEAQACIRRNKRPRPASFSHDDRTSSQPTPSGQQDCFATWYDDSIDRMLYLEPEPSVPGVMSTSIESEFNSIRSFIRVHGPFPGWEYDDVNHTLTESMSSLNSSLSHRSASARDSPPFPSSHRGPVPDTILVNSSATVNNYDWEGPTGLYDELSVDVLYADVIAGEADDREPRTPSSHPSLNSYLFADMPAGVQMDLLPPGVQSNDWGGPTDLYDELSVDVLYADVIEAMEASSVSLPSSHPSLNSLIFSREAEHDQRSFEGGGKHGKTGANPDLNDEDFQSTGQDIGRAVQKLKKLNHGLMPKQIRLLVASDTKLLQKILRTDQEAHLHECIVTAATKVGLCPLHSPAAAEASRNLSKGAGKGTQAASAQEQGTTAKGKGKGKTKDATSNAKTANDSKQPIKAKQESPPKNASTQPPSAVTNKGKGKGKNSQTNKASYQLLAEGWSVEPRAEFTDQCGAVYLCENVDDAKVIAEKSASKPFPIAVLSPKQFPIGNAPPQLLFAEFQKELDGVKQTLTMQGFLHQLTDQPVCYSKTARTVTIQKNERSRTTVAYITFQAQNASAQTQVELQQGKIPAAKTFLSTVMAKSCAVEILDLWNLKKVDTDPSKKEYTASVRIRHDQLNLALAASAPGEMQVNPTGDVKATMDHIWLKQNGAPLDNQEVCKALTATKGLHLGAFNLRGTWALRASHENMKKIKESLGRNEEPVYFLSNVPVDFNHFDVQEIAKQISWTISVKPQDYRWKRGGYSWMVRAPAEPFTWAFPISYGHERRSLHITPARRLTGARPVQVDAEVKHNDEIQFASWQAQLRSGKQLPRTQHKNGTFLEVLQKSGPPNKRHRPSDTADTHMTDASMPGATEASPDSDLKMQLQAMQAANLAQQKTIQELTQQIQQLMSMLEKMRAEQTPILSGGSDSAAAKDPDL